MRSSPTGRRETALGRRGSSLRSSSSIRFLIALETDRCSRSACAFSCSARLIGNQAWTLVPVGPYAVKWSAPVRQLCANQAPKQSDLTGSNRVDSCLSAACGACNPVLSSPAVPRRPSSEGRLFLPLCREFNPTEGPPMVAWSPRRRSRARVRRTTGIDPPQATTIWPRMGRDLQASSSVDALLAEAEIVSCGLCPRMR